MTDLSIPLFSSTTLTTSEKILAARIINGLPGLTFQVDVARNGQDVQGLLNALEATKIALQDLHAARTNLETQVAQHQADKAATRRYLGLDS